MRERITFDQCDTPEEVCDWLNKIRADQDIIEGQIVRLSSNVESLGRKIDSRATKSWVSGLLSSKKGSTVKKKGSASVRVLAILVILVSLVSLCHSAYVTTDINYEIASNPEMLATYLRDSFANMTSSTYLFTPGSQPSTADTVEGKVYYDSSASLLYVCLDGTNWTSLDTGAVSGYSLDASYNEGSTIDVDAAALTFTTSLGDDNVVMALVQNDSTNDGATLTIVSASDSTQASLDITSTAGYDIQGTSDTWSFSYAGALVCVGVDTTSTITLANDETIINDTEHEIQFGDSAANYEDISFVFGNNNNIIGLATDTGAATFEFGVIDDLTGIGSIAFDDAASTITLTSTGATDLTISQATADQDASLILQSTGTGADALSLRTHTNEGSIKVASADNLDIDAADNIAVDTAGGTYTLTTVGGDITLDASDKSVIIRGTETSTVAILLDADGAAGGIELQCGTGDITLDSGDDIFLEADTGTGDVISIINTKGTHASALILRTVAAGSIDIDSGDNITVGVADDYTVTLAGGTATFAVTGGDFDVDAVGGAVWLDSGEATDNAFDLDAASGGFDLDVAKSIAFTTTESESDSVNIDSAGGVDIDISGGAAGEDFAVTTDTSITFSTSEVAKDQFKVDATGACTQATGDAIVFETTNGGILLNADNADNGDIALDAADDLELTAGGDMVLTIGGHARIVDDDLVSFGTGDDITINYDEDGADNLQVIGPIDLETTYVEFRESPISAASAGGAAGTTGTNLMSCGFPAYTFEYFIIGTQTITTPVVGAYGIDIGMDDVENDGAEITEGITGRSRSAFTTGATGQYLEVVFYVTDADGSDDLRIGFRQAQAYDATLDNYDEMWAVGLKGVDWYSFTINNDAGTQEVDLDPGDCGDTEAHTVRIEIASGLGVTIYIDGTTPGNAPATDVETGEVLVPFFYYIHDSTTAEGLMITSWECGAL